MNKIIKKNIFRDVAIKKIIPSDPHPFNTNEIHLLLNNADGWFKNFLAFLFFTGARIGEILALHWDDIKLNNIVISKAIYNGIIDTTKTGRIRKIPIFNDLMPYIEAQKLINPQNRIFNSINSAQNAWYKWQKLLKKCDMKRRILYQARHTVAIRALDGKMSQLCYILAQMLYKHYARYVEPEGFDRSFSILRQYDRISKKIAEIQ